MIRVNSGAFCRTAAISLLLLAAVTGCKPAPTTSEGISGAATPDKTTAEVFADWQWLFNGESVEAWTDKSGKAIGEQWQIIDNALVLTAAGGGDGRSVGGDVPVDDLYRAAFDRGDQRADAQRVRREDLSISGGDLAR